MSVTEQSEARPQPLPVVRPARHPGTVPASKSSRRTTFLRLVKSGPSTSQRTHAAPRPAYLATKRGMDIVLASLALVVLSPFLLTIALFIRGSSPGPAIFTQIRTGRGRQPFRIYKFRTMFSDRCDAAGIKQTVEGDCRVTALGSLLRRTNIDELPQLLNVIKGDMSLVGPRPHVPGMLAGGIAYEELVAHYHDRHIVRPGLTGLAQAEGFRGPTVDIWRARRRIEYDLEYVAHMSLWLDIKIICKTLWGELRRGSGF